MGNSSSALPYTIGSQVGTPQDHNGWAVHAGNRKSDGLSVTVFVAKKPLLAKAPANAHRPSSKTQLEAAYHHFQFCKRLRHPHVLKVYATLDTDNANDDGTAATSAPPSKDATGDLIVVTEPCVRLDQWLVESRPRSDQIAWGLESIVQGLQFLHTNAKVLHGNLSPSSLYVTQAGDVKLWNFSITTALPLSEHFLQYEGLVTPQAYRSPERHESRWEAINACGVHAVDTFGLGVLIGHMYNGHIPDKLQKATQRLQTANVKSRPKLGPLLKCPVFSTNFKKLQVSLQEIAVQPVEQKVAFWQNLGVQLGQSMDIFPKDVAVYKVIPILKESIVTICQNESMLTQDLYRREVLAILQPLFMLSQAYLGENFGPELSHVIKLLFAVSDRGVRGFLLSKASLLVQHLDSTALNQNVFEPMCSGFSDSSAALRELTLKATLVLVPHLNQPNVEKLSRYLVRLQNDPEATIRTNTVIFIGKLAPHLTEVSRQKMMMPAFCRAFKDPFHPCRLAALQSTIKCKDLYDAEGVATRVLPAVMPTLLDPVKDVRKEAFTVVEELLVVLRIESDRMERDQAGQAPAVTAAAPTAPGGAIAPAPASGGYLSGLSSWMSTSSKADPVVSENQPAPAPATAPVPASTSSLPMGSTVQSALNNTSDDMGWGDDDDDLDLSNHDTPALDESGDDDFFASFDSKPAKPAKSGSLQIKKKESRSKTSKPIVTATKLEVDDTDWDDF